MQFMYVYVCLCALVYVCVLAHVCVHAYAFIYVFMLAEPGIYSPVELLDFGILRTLDDPKTLRLNLINTGAKAAHITVS